MKKRHYDLKGIGSDERIIGSGETKRLGAGMLTPVME